MIDAEFCEHLYEAGRGPTPPHFADIEEDGDDELQQACQHVNTDGQCFRHHLMTELFNSPSSRAEHRHM